MAKKTEQTPARTATAPSASVAERLATPKATSTINKPATGSDPQSEVSGRVIFTKLNWYLFFGGVGLMALGFILMSIETAEYGFGPLGLTVGPIVLALSFVVEFFAIMYREKPANTRLNPNS